MRASLLIVAVLLGCDDTGPTVVYSPPFRCPKGTLMACIDNVDGWCSSQTECPAPLVCEPDDGGFGRCVQPAE